MADNNDAAKTAGADGKKEDEAAADGGVVGILTDIWERAEDVIEDAAAAVKDTVVQAVGPQVHAFGEISTQLKDKVEQWLLEQLMLSLEHMIDLLPVIIKSSLNKDPDMIQWMWRRSCRFIDKQWPEFRRELVEDLELMIGIKGEPRNLVDNQKPGYDPIRRYLRYSIMPWDKSIWGKFKSPIFILFIVVMLSPISFISFWAFFVYFLVIDKTDEYQLVKFILYNKSSQFIAQGIIRTLVGYFIFFDCVTIYGSTTDHNCDSSGPGTWGPVWLILSGWIGQVALCWLAAALLVCANPRQGMLEQAAEELHGGPVVQTSEEPAEGADKPNARLRHNWTHQVHDRTTKLWANAADQDKKHIRQILIYDAICTLLTAGALVWVGVDVNNLENFVTRQAIFAGQLTYGFLAVPFFIFQLPICQKLLLHIKPTSYDQKGRCRFYRGPVKPEKPGVDRDLSMGAEFGDKLMGQLMTMFAGADARNKPADAHAFGPIQLEEGEKKSKKCKHCKTRMQNPEKQGQQCSQCHLCFCNECAEHEAHCTMAPQIDAPAAPLTLEERYDNFTSNFKFTGGVVYAMMTMSSTEDTEKFMKLIRTWMKKQSNEAVEAVVERIPVLLKWMAEDPDMPPMVRRGKNKFIDKVWVDMHEEILYNCQAMLDGEEVATEDTDPRPGVDCLRAAIRYHEYPYNRSIIWQLQRPLWWVLRIIPCIPWGAILPIFFLFIFLIIDKSDEFQLVQFIILFKGTSFLSHGLIKMVVGFFLYLACTSQSTDGFTHTCSSAGPGVQTGWRVFEIAFGGWILQIILAWLAFLLMPFSKDKGRVKLASDELKKEKNEEAAPAEGQAATLDRHKSSTDIEGGLQAGGKIRYLLFWDMIFFLSAMGVMIWMLVDRGMDWITYNVFYTCQIMYGFMSLPFFLFQIPVIRETFTHSVPTGYDKKGRLRPLESPPAKDQETLDKQFKELDREMRRVQGLPEEPENREGEGIFTHLLHQIQDVFKSLFGDWFGSDDEAAKKGDAVTEEQGGFLHAVASRLNFGGTAASGEGAAKKKDA